MPEMSKNGRLSQKCQQVDAQAGNAEKLTVKPECEKNKN